MSIRARSRSPQREETELEARARRAVRAFRKILPGLNAYVKVISGNPKLRIEIVNDNGSSARNRIFFQPPIQMGDEVKHEYMYCDQRDQDGVQVCASCRIHESIYAVIYHELGHICMGTFANPKTRDVERVGKAVEKLFADRPIELADHKANFVKRWEAKRKQNVGEAGDNNSFMGLAMCTAPYMGGLYNAVEDARVNEQIFAAREGVRAMYDGMMMDTSRKGVPDPAGIDPPTRWRDSSSQFQMTLGVYFALAGYDYRAWLQEEVADEIDNPDLQSLLGEFSTKWDGAQSLEYTVRVMEQLNKQGFLLSETPPPPPEPEPELEPDEKEEQQDGEPSPEDQQSDSDESDDEGSSPGPGQDGGSGKDKSEQPAQPDNAAGSGGSGQAPEPQTPPESEDGTGDGDPEDTGNDDDESSEREPAGGGGDEPSSDKDESPGSADGEQSSEDTSGDGDSENDNKADPDDLTDEIDTGADKGEGGIPLQTQEDFDRPFNGAEENNQCIGDMAGISEKAAVQQGMSEQQVQGAIEAITEALQRAAMQEFYFETGSMTIRGVKILQYGKDKRSWDMHSESRGPITPDVTEPILQRSLLRLRLALEENRRSGMERNRTSGRVNGRVLGKRAPVGDERLFQKKRLPKKRSYVVIIGMDLSYSLEGMNLRLEKQAVYAQAELLHRAGIPFAIYGHSHDYDDMLIMQVKTVDDAWNPATKAALMDTQATSGNLDGHALEFLRKRADEADATDVIIMYYSDGKMPASNYEEELTILQREIRRCQLKRYTLLGVGIRTDSPTEHGLETVIVNGSEDTENVVRFMQKKLIHR